MLYHWKNVTITFPQSLTGLCDEITIDNLNELKHDHTHQQIKDLFILPTFDELDEVACDDAGKPKRLDKNQLKSIKLNG